MIQFSDLAAVAIKGFAIGAPTIVIALIQFYSPSAPNLIIQFSVILFVANATRFGQDYEFSKLPSPVSLNAFSIALTPSLACLIILWLLSKSTTLGEWLPVGLRDEGNGLLWICGFTNMVAFQAGMTLLGWGFRLLSATISGTLFALFYLVSALLSLSETYLLLFSVFNLSLALYFVGWKGGFKLRDAHRPALSSPVNGLTNLSIAFYSWAFPAALVEEYSSEVVGEYIFLFKVSQLLGLVQALSNFWYLADLRDEPLSKSVMYKKIQVSNFLFGSLVCFGLGIYGFLLGEPAYFFILILMQLIVVSLGPALMIRQLVGDYFRIAFFCLTSIAISVLYYKQVSSFSLVVLTPLVFGISFSTLCYAGLYGRR